MVGLHPSYAKSPDNSIFAIGGMTSDWTSKTKLTWNDINSDEMRPLKAKEGSRAVPSLPHLDGRSTLCAIMPAASVAQVLPLAGTLTHAVQLSLVYQSSS
jgi:hypothetical protein